ncbi:MAG: hypothetical protein EXS68_02360 [Candidatus Ryanbacteria bacterium]|nr:hypothetical protein [Candidatus Ryanbacteria bacterium]
MTSQEFMKPENLEKYSFLWSEARLIIAALALLLGGTPPLYWLLGSSVFYGFIGTILTLSWLISGAASVYLGWRWYTGGQKVFGKKDTRDTVMFFVSVVSGINLGLVGFLGSNIGMRIASGRIVFAITAVLYIVAALHLWTRWNAHGKKVF